MRRIGAAAAAVATATALCCGASSLTQRRTPPTRRGVDSHALHALCAPSIRRCSTQVPLTGAETTRATSFSSATSSSTGRERSYLGVVNVTSRNINSELDTRVPTFLYFMVTNHPDVVDYTSRLSQQIDQTNHRLEFANMAQAYQEFGKDSGLAIKLCVVDCLKEPGIMQRYPVHPHAFPIIFFLLNHTCCDRLVGTVTDANIRDAIEAFITHAKKEMAEVNDGNGKGTAGRIERQDDDDENAMTLLNTARDAMQKKDHVKAKKLFTKALTLSLRDMEVVNERYGVARKQMTRELWLKLKREACYNTAPTALCGLALCALSTGRKEESVQLVQRVRHEYPFAVHDLRDVGAALARIELVHIADCDVESDTYEKLLRYDELTENVADFYRMRLKLAALYFIKGTHKLAIEESLRLIRSEPKMLSALKETKIVPADLILGPRAVTPARQALNLMFESLGPTNEHVLLGRRMLQQYI